MPPKQKRVIKKKAKRAVVKRIAAAELAGQIPPSTMRQILRGIGGLGGGVLGALTTGSLLGAKKGWDYGHSAGDNASTILGLGKYTIRKNSLVGSAESTGVPYMHSTNESTVIRHREYIQDVVSSGTANAFSISSFPLNPGQSQTFPWLSAIAAQYQEYTFKGLLFEFRSTSADAIASSTNTTLGSVMLGTVYNPALAAFVSKTGMLNSYYSTDGKPSENICHFVECDPKENPFNIQYVRPGAVPTNGNIQNFDLGAFQIATTGFQGTSVVAGELWVSYEIELRKPTPLNLTGQDNNLYRAYATASISTTNYFGTSQVQSNQDWFDGTVTLGGTTITIVSPYAGPFALFYAVTGTSTLCTIPTMTTTTNCTGYNIFNNSGASVSSDTGVANTTMYSFNAFSITQTAASVNTVVITFSGATLPTSPTGMNLLIFPLVTGL